MTLASAKVGDKLAVYTNGRVPRIEIVAAVGKVHIVTTGGTKYAIRTGREAGASGWNAITADLATDEDLLLVRIEQLQRAINRIQVTRDNHELVAAFLKELRQLNSVETTQ